MKNSSSDNLTNSFTIHEMYGCECMTLKEMNIILVFLMICSFIDSIIDTSA